MAYRIKAIPMTLSDLQGHLSASLFKRDFWQDFNWQCAAQSICDSWSSCYETRVMLV